MDRSNRAAQFYGYAVCFITVIVMLMSVKGVLDAAFDLSDPVRGRDGRGGYGRSGRDLTSFELYKMDTRREAGTLPGPGSDSRGIRVDTISRENTVSSDADLRRRYEAEREAQIRSTKFQATRSLFSGLLFIVLAGVLFLIHWRWLRGITSASATP